ncbi:uncharacterized protein NEMAJ01_1021 [Nematocida major]|uniref:uncharacterized protein n=1 Tax=Nematocida major TaxID=1912982 RepID=UPI002007F10E|nr:uncharacterized protein NEMAJ01_1021 [Nematocida major]KAH9386125.1 hypothetical protein NEMAJ01_1021 [Nematocida major]
MEDSQPIRLDLDKLKCKLLKDTANTKTTGSERTVLAALSSRIKDSLRNIPEEKRTEVEALVDTFLQKELDPVFRTIVNTHCALTPEVVEILTKEAIAELPSAFLRELSILSTRIDIFSLEQKIPYQKWFQEITAKETEAFAVLRGIYKRIIFHSRKIFQKEIIKKFKTSELELAFFRETNRSDDVSSAFRVLLKEEETTESMLRKTEAKKEELLARERTLKGLEREGCILGRSLEKARSHFSKDTDRPNVYFYLKEITENNGKCELADKVVLLERYEAPGGNVHSIEEVAEKIKSAEKECSTEEKQRLDAANAIKNQVVSKIRSIFEHVAASVSEDSISEIKKLIVTVEKEMENLQGPEKAEMEEFRDELREYILMMSEHFAYSLNCLSEILDCLDAEYSLEELPDACASEKLADFNESFRKIQERFPNQEIHSGYSKVFQDLIKHPGVGREKEQKICRNQGEAERCLIALRRLEQGETMEGWSTRTAEYEVFAESNPAPDTFDSIEEISLESLKDRITPREIKAMLPNLKMSREIYIYELKDENMANCRRAAFEKVLLETQKKIDFLELKLRFSENLIEETLRKNELLRYSYLKKYKSKCLLHVDRLKEKANADMALLAKEVMREIEETPNNPELNEKVKSMLEETAQKEPHRLLTPRFIVENKHFAEELPRVIVQLDKKIAETLEGSSNGKSKYHLTLQSSILALFFVFMLLSLGLVCSSEFA